MSRLITFIALGALVSLMGGCVFDTASTRSTRASTDADIANLKNEVKRLKTEVTLLREEMDDFTRDQRDDMTDLKATVRKMEDQVGAVKTNVIKDINAKITALENRRIKVTNKLNTRIDDVVREVTSVLGKMKSGGTASRVTSGGTEKGFYHTVVSGESPWSIAQKYKSEYGVTTQDILDANDLKSGDSIRPGQKLFIPIKR